MDDIRFNSETSVGSILVCGLSWMLPKQRCRPRVGCLITRAEQEKRMLGEQPIGDFVCFLAFLLGPHEKA